jgi:hypothetical protein
VEPGSVFGSIHEAPITLVRLDASDPDLRTRVRARVAGGGPMLAGDDIARHPERVSAIADRAVSERALPLREDEHLVDATGAPGDVAASVIELAQDAAARRIPSDGQ